MESAAALAPIGDSAGPLVVGNLCAAASTFSVAVSGRCGFRLFNCSSIVFTSVVLTRRAKLVLELFNDPPAIGCHGRRIPCPR